MEQSERLIGEPYLTEQSRRIGEPYLLIDHFIVDIINGIRSGFDTLSYSDKVACYVDWHELLHTYEREIEEDAMKVADLIIRYSGILPFDDLCTDISYYLKRGKYPQDIFDKQLYLIDEERLLKEKPFLKEEADKLEKYLKGSSTFNAQVEEELTPVKSYLQAIIDLASVFSFYREAVGQVARFVAHKQDETLKAKASDFSPRANTAKCKEAEETLNTYFTPTEDFKLHNDSEKTDIQRIILGGILTEQDNNDYSDRKTDIKKKEVLNALSTLVKFYKPKDNWWNDLALHRKKQPKCKVLATITNCNEESIRTYSKKKEGEDDYEIKKALFGK